MIWSMLRWVLVVWVGLIIGIMSMMFIGTQLPDEGSISMWFRYDREAQQVRWDLRSHHTAFTDAVPFGGILAPDGTIFVTADFRQGQTWLYRSEPNNLERTLIGQYDYEASVSPPLWADDSQSILIVDTFTTLVTRIVLIDIETGADTVISKQNYITRVAEWSPDGEHVLLRNFLNHIPAIEVRIVNTTTGDIILFPLLLEARWSPDGHYLAYQTVDEPHIINLHHVTTGETQSKILARTGGTSSLNMIWSPDSQQIAFSYADGIYQYDIDTGALMQLVNQVAQLRGWSPDGETLALYILERNKQQLYFLRYKTRELVPVTGLSVRISAGMSWSTNGQHLVLSDVDRRIIRVEVIDVASADVQQRLQYMIEHNHFAYPVDGTLANWWQAIRVLE